MTPYDISATNVSFSYRRTADALKDVTWQVEPGTISGLLGRNGSGKSTLASLLAGHMRGSGELLVGGQDPYENREVMAGVAFVGDHPAIMWDSKLTATIDMWQATRENWSADLAGTMLDTWGLDPTKDVPTKLSRGQQSAFFATLGVASRAPLTIFDEVHLGMDAVVRREFYDFLLEDFVRHQRTIIISSHLISEVEDLLENVAFIHRGSIIASGNSDDIRAAHSKEGAHASLTDILITLSKEQS